MHVNLRRPSALTYTLPSADMASRQCPLWLRRQHKCFICAVTLSAEVTSTLYENNNSYVKVCKVAWLLCLMCERYVHFLCLCKYLSLFLYLKHFIFNKVYKYIVYHLSCKFTFRFHVHLLISFPHKYLISQYNYLSLDKSQYLDDLNFYETGGRFFCSNCRQVSC